MCHTGSECILRQAFLTDRRALSRQALNFSSVNICRVYLLIQHMGPNGVVQRLSTKGVTMSNAGLQTDI